MEIKLADSFTLSQEEWGGKEMFRKLLKIVLLVVHSITRFNHSWNLQGVLKLALLLCCCFGLSFIQHQVASGKLLQYYKTASKYLE